MKYRLIEKTYETATVNDQISTDWEDVGGAGGDSLAYVVSASNSATPDGSVQLEGSLDKNIVVPVGSATDITDDGVFPLVQDRPPYRYYRLTFAMDSGSADISTSVLVKGDRE